MNKIGDKKQDNDRHYCNYSDCLELIPSDKRMRSELLPSLCSLRPRLAGSRLHSGRQQPLKEKFLRNFSKFSLGIIVGFPIDKN